MSSKQIDIIMGIVHDAISVYIDQETTYYDDVMYEIRCRLEKL